MAETKISPLTFDDTEEAPLVDIDSPIPQEEPVKNTKEPTKQQTEPPKEEQSIEEPEDKPLSAEEYMAQEPEKDEEPQDPSKLIDYKQMADYMVESGQWDEFSMPEDAVLDAEGYAKLTELQFQRKVQQAIAEEKSAFGGPANQLIDYLKNGGTIDDFVSSMQSQTDIESISLEDTSGQERMIREYYSAMGEDKKWIDKQVNRLKDEGDDEFLAEAEKCKTKLLKEINEQREAMVREQEAIAEDNKLRAQRFASSLKKEIHSDKDLADREKKALEKFAFEYKFENQETGQKFSEMAVKFNEIQSDPKKYYKFLRFIKNFDEFEEKTKTERETKKKDWNFLVSSKTTLSDVAPAEPVKAPKNTSKIPAFKFD